MFLKQSMIVFVHFYEIIYIQREGMFKERLMIVRAGNDFRDYWIERFSNFGVYQKNLLGVH